MSSSLNSIIGRLFIVGFGAQAKAWAQNFSDEKIKFQILLRQNSPSLEICQKLGLAHITIEELHPKTNDCFIMLIPDHTHQETLLKIKTKNADTTQPALTFVYAHGFSYSKNDFKKLSSSWSHLLLAPKAIASEVRNNYLSKETLAAVYSTEGNQKDMSVAHAEEILFYLAKHLGINQGPFKTTFQEETYADLFSEQALLCSLLPYGAKTVFDSMLKRGVSPEVAYLECWHEVKLIADAMLKFGPEGFHGLISPNALYGGEKARQIIFDKAFGEKLEKMADDIWSGRFYKEIDNVDFENLRKKVVKEWQESDLAAIRKKMLQKT